MPVISTFFGIVIRMYYHEHDFHAEYQGQQATFTTNEEILGGSIGSRTAVRLIKEWSLAHQSELEANRGRARESEPLERIAPLD